MIKTVLGIHSNTTRSKGNGGAGYSSVRNKPGEWMSVIEREKAEGHAWISVTKGGATTTYGLWPDAHPSVEDNGAASDVRTGMENNGQATASRYYLLTHAQSQVLMSAIGNKATWRYTNNCSSWASAIIQTVVKEDVNADDWGLLGVETPRKLGASILKLEKKSETSRDEPYDINAQERSSSLFGF